MSLRSFRGVCFGLVFSLVAVRAAAESPPPATAVAGLVRGIKVLPDKAPDCSSLKAIVETVTRGCGLC